MEVEMRSGAHGRIWHKKEDSNHWHREDGPAYIADDGSKEWWYYHDINYMNDSSKMPLNLFLAYVKWELKKNGE